MIGAGGSNQIIRVDTYNNSANTILPNQVLHLGMELCSQLTTTDFSLHQECSTPIT